MTTILKELRLAQLYSKNERLVIYKPFISRSCKGYSCIAFKSRKHIKKAFAFFPFKYFIAHIISFAESRPPSTFNGIHC